MPGALAARNEWELSAHPESVSAARTAVREFAEAQGVDEIVLMDVALAVTEAVTNAVLHAFLDRPPGTIRVTAAAAARQPGPRAWAADDRPPRRARRPARARWRRHRAVDDVRHARGPRSGGGSGAARRRVADGPGCLAGRGRRTARRSARARGRR